MTAQPVVCKLRFTKDADGRIPAHEAPACRYPGGAECPTIFDTVPRSIPKRRAASRWLTPSRSTATLTFEYSATPYILPPPDQPS